MGAISNLLFVIGRIEAEEQLSSIYGSCSVSYTHLCSINWTGSGENSSLLFASESEG